MGAGLAKGAKPIASNAAKYEAPANTSSPASHPPPLVFPKGLDCTVQEARSNTFTPFASSVVHATGLLSCHGSFSFGAGKVSSDPSSPLFFGASAGNNAEYVVFGDYVIPVPFRSRGGVKTESPPPAGATGGMVKGLGGANGGWGRGGNALSPTTSAGSGFAMVAALRKTPSTADANVFQPPVASPRTPSVGPVTRTQFGDLIIAGTGHANIPPPPMNSTAPEAVGWFSSLTRVAIPVSYVFKVCAGQAGPIRCISSNAEGTGFAVAVAGNKVCSYIDATSGQTVMGIKGHLDPILCCSHSKDGKFIVTTSADCTVMMWDLNNGKKLRELPVTSQATVCAINDDSDTLATTSTDDIINLWDCKSCEPLSSFQQHTSSIFAIAFARRGGVAASGAMNGELYVWTVAAGETVHNFARHRTPVLAVSFSHDGQRLCSCDREALRVWDLFAGQPVLCRDAKGRIIAGADDVASSPRPGPDELVRYTSCAFVAGNLIAASFTSKCVILIDPNNGLELLSIGTKSVVTSFSASWSGESILCGDFNGNLYRWQLKFAARDRLAFHMDSRPQAAEKSKDN